MPGQYKRTFPYTFLPLCLAATGKELINNITPPLSPGKGSPYYKTRRDHTVTSCEAVQDEAIKAGFFFSSPQTKDTFCLRMLKAHSGSNHCCQQKYNSSRSGNMPGSTTLHLGCQQSSPTSQKSILRCCMFPLTRFFCCWRSHHKCRLVHFSLLAKASGFSGITCGALHPSALTANGIARPIPSSHLHSFEISLLALFQALSAILIAH